MFGKMKMKLKLIKNISDFYEIKTGTIYKYTMNKSCYKTSDLFSFIYRIYTDFLLILILPIIIFVYIQDHFENVYLSVLLTIIFHILIEFIFLFIMPLEKVNCWEKSLQEKNKGMK